jgi:hypothetical protein
MAYFKRDKFSGIAPGVAPNLLAEQFGQIAENIDFESGSLVPIKKEGSVEHTFTSSGSQKQSIYFFDNSANDVWLGWNNAGVKAVEGPIPGDNLDRLYWTGDTYPKMGVYSTIVSGAAYPNVSYRLGVPAPSVPWTQQPSIASGSIDATVTPEDVAYVVTFVTAYGEEGPPSIPSAPLEVTFSTQTVTVPLSSAGSSGNYNFGTGALKRIYRSNTGSVSTQFQLVDEVPFSQTSYTDTKTSSVLQEVLPSTYWIGPPDDNTSLYPDGQMQGLIAVANGVLAGFTGKRLCLSEAYLPHAWPISYRITLAEDIVDIGTTANGIVCLTNGKPYFVTGVDPSAMSALQIDLAQACVNRASVVDMGEYVLYAGPDGLCAISATEGRVVTKGLISVEQWNADFAPTTIKAFKHEGTYIAFFEDGSNHKGWVYDPRADEAAISTITSEYTVYGGYTDPRNGELYILDAASTGVNRRIRKWRGDSGTSYSDTNKCKWKSKKIVLPQPASMAWVGVFADEYPGTVGGSYAYALQIKVWADGVVIADYHITDSGNTYYQNVTTPASAVNSIIREPIVRLPAVTAREWEVQVESQFPVREICLSQTMDEIKSA